MRLLQRTDDDGFRLIEFFGSDVPSYAILSHTWSADDEEVTFKDILKGTGKDKPGYAKIQFCREQAQRDNLQYFWVDTCCIDKSSSSELSEAINSMFRWYQDASRCYVYLSDLSIGHSRPHADPPRDWKIDFKNCRWFSRGWTLQELIAPASVEFFSSDGIRLGDKRSLEQALHEITGISREVFQGQRLADISVHDRMLWTVNRQTKREEDLAYSLLGIFNIHMPLIYGEGRVNAFMRLNREIDQTLRDAGAPTAPPWLPDTVTKRSVDVQPRRTSSHDATPRQNDMRFITRLYEIVCEVRDHVTTVLQNIPKASSYFASIIHTSPYHEWAQNGGLLWCSMETNSNDPAWGMIAAMIMQHLAASYTDQSPIILYPGLFLVDQNSDRNGSGESPQDGADSSQFLRNLVLQSLFPSSGTITSFQSVVERLSSPGYEIFKDIIREPCSTPNDMLLILLQRLLDFFGKPLIIALDDIDFVKNLSAKHKCEDILHVFSALLARNNLAAKTHIVIGGKPEMEHSALKEAYSVDSTTEYQGTHRMPGRYIDMMARLKFTECLHSLFFDGQHTREDQIIEAHPDTNSWLLNHSSYVSWQQDSSSILWIEGKPGSGKSVLGKEILKILKQDRNVLSCGWFFSTRGGHILMSHSSLLRSILFQLLQQSPIFLRHFECVYRKYAPRSRPKWNCFDTMQGILWSIIATGCEIRCLIDAMDEAEIEGSEATTRREILRTLSDLVIVVEQSRFKIIVCSRPSLDIDMEFSNHRHHHGRIHRIVLENENSLSIQILVNDGIMSLRRAMRSWGNDFGTAHSVIDEDSVGHQSQKIPLRNVTTKFGRLDLFQKKQREIEEVALESIGSYLLANAQGVILWITLILDILRSTIKRGMYTFTELEKRLTDLPTELNGVYQYCIDEIRRKFNGDDILKIRRILMFVSGANTLGPLQIGELWEALATPQDVEAALNSETDPIAEGRVHITTWREFRWQIHAMCGPLVEVVNVRNGVLPSDAEDYDIDATDTVQLLHRTTKDFLASNECAGTLSFSDKEALELVTNILRTYAEIVMPQKPTGYTNFIHSTTGSLESTIEAATEFISDKLLLPFVLEVLPKSRKEKQQLLGVFRSLLDMPSLTSHAIAPQWKSQLETDRYYPYASNSEATKCRVSAYFIEQACSNGFCVAVLLFLEIVAFQCTRDISYAMRDASLLVAIRQELLDLVESLAAFDETEPECRFWEEEEYDIMGRICYLTPFEIAAVQSGNESVARVVYDRNHRVRKDFPYDQWENISHGRECWRRTWEERCQYFETIRMSKGDRQTLDPASLKYVREAVTHVLHFCSRYNNKTR